MHLSRCWNFRTSKVRCLCVQFSPFICSMCYFPMSLNRKSSNNTISRTWQDKHLKTNMTRRISEHIAIVQRMFLLLPFYFRKQFKYSRKCDRLWTWALRHLHGDGCAKNLPQCGTIRWGSIHQDQIDNDFTCGSGRRKNSKLLDLVRGARYGWREAPTTYTQDIENDDRLKLLPSQYNSPSYRGNSVWMLTTLTVALWWKCDKEHSGNTLSIAPERSAGLFLTML